MSSALLICVALTTAIPQNNAIDLRLFAGWGATVMDSETSRSNAPALALTVRYRPPYFLAPHIDLGWAGLVSTHETARIDGTATTLDSSMEMIWLVAGPSFDFGRLHIAVGMGVFQLLISSTLGDSTITPTELDLGYSARVGYWIMRFDWLEIGASLRGVYVAEADIFHFAIGVDVGGTPLSW